MFHTLIIDDDPALRYELKRCKIFGDCGFKISNEAENGKDGLRIMETEGFDLVVLDMEMPVMNGVAFIQALRARNDSTCVLILSGSDAYSYTRQAIRLGAFDYLLKPIVEQELAVTLEAIKKHLTEASADRHLSELFSLSGDELNSKLFLNHSNGTIQALCTYIIANIGMRITLDQAADALGYSPKYLGSLFKDETGLSIVDYITMVKMEHAKTLLVRNAMKVYEVCDMLGYKDIDYFSRRFKQYHGLPPHALK